MEHLLSHGDEKGEEGESESSYMCEPVSFGARRMISNSSEWAGRGNDFSSLGDSDLNWI